MTDDVVAQAMADAKASAENQTASQARLVAEAIMLMNEQIALEDHKSVLEDQLKNINEKLVEVRESKLPDAMLSANMGKHTLSDGSVVSIEATCYTSYKADDEKEVMDWFVDNGYSGIITPKLLFNFPKGEIYQASLFIKAVENLKGEIYKEVNRLAEEEALVAERKEGEAPMVFVFPTPNMLNGTVKAEIHWSTLRKVGREICDNEELTAPKQLNLHPVSRTKIKRNK